MPPRRPLPAWATILSRYSSGDLCRTMKRPDLKDSGRGVVEREFIAYVEAHKAELVAKARVREAMNFAINSGILVLTKEGGVKFQDP